MRRRSLMPLVTLPPPPPPPPPLFDGARWPQKQDGWSADESPRAVPLTYPGRCPDESVLLTRSAMKRLHLLPGRRLGQARVELDDAADSPDEGPSAIRELSLNYVLARLNAPPAASRAPVLAVGSNAAPSQMRHKFSGPGVSLIIPMVLAKVEGLAAGVAAEATSLGYMPATPIVGSDYESQLFIQWLDAHQLATLDATEPGYRRVLLPAGDPAHGGVRITLPSGEVLGACYAYVSTAGCLVDDSGVPVQLGDQRELLTALLRSRRLRREVGASADSWVEQIKRHGKVEAVNDILAAEGWVGQDLWLDQLATEQDAPHGGGSTPADSGAAIEPTTRTYGKILPATPPSPGTWWVVPTGPTVKRRAQAMVQVAEPVYEQLGRPDHVAVQASFAAGRADMARLETIAQVQVDSTADLPLDRVQVDYVIRDAIGVEVGETVHLTPVDVRRRSWSDGLIGPPLYMTVRVQAADLVTVEREVCLLDGLTLELLGVKSGDEVVLEGRAAPDGVVEQVRVKAFATTSAVLQSREHEQGGDFSVRYPSARDALGIHPDIPWIFLDKTTRALLGLGRQQLATVRVRAGRTFQARQEVREMLLVLLIALLGLVGLVDNTAAQVGIVTSMLLAILAAIVVRMRGRLTHRVSRSTWRHRTRDHDTY